jgi:hypothetical protein
MVTRYAHPTDNHKFEAIRRIDERATENGSKETDIETGTSKS